MDLISHSLYLRLVSWRADLSRIVDHCRQAGADLPDGMFQEGCAIVLERLGDPLDEDLERHFRSLVRSGDRLAAIHMLLPASWAYTVERDRAGRATARVAPPHVAETAVIECDEEASALLGAIALAIQWWQPQLAQELRHKEL